jgi:hypothetical protein
MEMANGIKIELLLYIYTELLLNRDFNIEQTGELL